MKITLIPTILICVLICKFSSSYGQTVMENKLDINYNLVKFVNNAFSDLSQSYELRRTVQNQSMSLLDELNDFFNRSANIALIDHLINTATSRCAKDLEYALESAWSRKGWAFNMLDSYAKPGSGILQGNVKWIGNYDECVNVYAPLKPGGTRGDFHGIYCAFQVNVYLNETPIPFSMGVCLPDSCKELTTDEMEETNRKILPGYGRDSIFANETLICQPTSRKVTGAAIGVIFLLCVAILLALIGSSITAYEYLTKTRANDFSESFPPIGEPDNRSLQDDGAILGKKGRRLPTWIQKCKPFFNCFCAFTNGEKLLNTSNVEGQMLCLHGIRFLSMTWVIVCHAYMFCYTVVRNAREAIPLIDTWPFQVILNGFFSVDSFFLLSGFLLAYLFFEQSHKSNEKIPWLYFYVHRYLRLTPVYMVVLGFFTAVFPIMGSGPFWPTYDIEPHCQKTWWMNLLYINNFQRNSDMCMGWSWYLANDMQFFVISPLFLIPLSRLPVTGFSIMSVFFCATFISNFAITYYYDLPGGIGNLAELTKGNTNFMNEWGDFMDKVYQKPYTRIGPYLVGVAIAYYIYKHKQRNGNKNNLVVLTIGWILASGVTLACQFGLYHRNFSPLEAGFYNAFSRTCFGCGLGWVIYVCLTGQSKFINGILSFKLFIPLSRLTYCAYLVHPIVQSVYFGTLRNTLSFSHITMVLIFLGLLVVSYGSAFVTSLLFESPIIRLEKIIRNKFNRTRSL